MTLRPPIDPKTTRLNLISKIKVPNSRLDQKVIIQRLLRLLSTMPDLPTSLGQPCKRPKKHRKRPEPDLTGKCLNQEVAPGIFQSSQATFLELSASPDLLGPPDAARHLLEPPGDAPGTQKTTRLDRKTPQVASRHPGQSSQATVLEIWLPLTS